MKDRYFRAIETLFSTIRETQLPAIDQAAQIAADAVAKGHSIHLYDTGHIIDSEIMNRAGGFALIRSFKYDLKIDSSARIQSEYENDKDRRLDDLATLALKAANVYPGDVMFIGSVSGTSASVVSLAMACQKMGVKVVALTSVSYSSELEGLHLSKKKLYQVNDVLIDNCAPFGDAMLEVKELKQKFIPASGLAAAYIMWAVNAELLELLLNKGIKPGVLGSVNYPPNVSFNEDLEEQYQKKGI